MLKKILVFKKRFSKNFVKYIKNVKMYIKKVNKELIKLKN